MNQCLIPTGYQSTLDLYETQEAIQLIKGQFQKHLGEALHLKRVSAPLFVAPESGLNDNLNGVERPVCFDIPAANAKAEVVHSLAKWKRMALYRYDFHMGKGLYTDMNAIRRDEELDNMHSVYVDQWDWEKIIPNRTIETLKQAVQLIMQSICKTLEALKEKFPQVQTELCPEPYFITTQELESQYPNLTPDQREKELVKQHKTAFLMQIGGALKSGTPHGLRAPDYDDWQLNGDLLFHHELLDTVIEISSMGIRVDRESLEKQLVLAGKTERKQLPFHQLLLQGKLPDTMGGGIGQSRLCMLLLQKAHIGEVQSSIWDKETYQICENAGVTLL